MLAGPGTFAGLTSLTADDWSEIREKSKAATAASRTWANGRSGCIVAMCGGRPTGRSAEPNSTSSANA
jgi:hypothetical protein